MMQLAAEPFEWVNAGQKIVEVRLFDEKRKKLALGDTIVFRSLDGNGVVRVRVRGLLRFDSFRDLFVFVPKEYLHHANLTVEEQVQRMRRYYSEEEEKKFGILAIYFEVIR
ncbi:MAG: ASCH domain-containing protein [Candidatus Micrarchaeia archaeon]